MTKVGKTYSDDEVIALAGQQVKHLGVEDKRVRELAEVWLGGHYSADVELASCGYGQWAELFP